MKIILFSFITTILFNSVFPIVSWADNGKMSPYINFESTLITSYSELKTSTTPSSTTFHHTNTFTAGLGIEKSNFIVSLNGVLPWHRDDMLQLSLDSNVGYNYKNFLFYFGKITDLKNKEEHDILTPYYFGVETYFNPSKIHITLDAQYQFGDYIHRQWTSGQGFWGYDEFIDKNYNAFSFSSKVSLTKNKAIPYIKLTLERWNFNDDIQINTAIGFSFLGKPHAKYQSPKHIQVDYSPIYYVDKPAIYLYPPTTQKIEVLVEPKNGHLTKTIPDYGRGWSVTATPNSLIDDQFDYLFYEGALSFEIPEKGWCLESDTIESFFLYILPKYGLNQTEINDFMEYWMDRLPHLNSPYFIISPMLNSQIDSICPMHISPVPDNLLRLWFTFAPVEQKQEIERPIITPFNRSGFSVIEWGGTIIE